MKKLILYIVLLATISCQKVVEDYELKVHEPKIVLNALAMQDSVFEFRVLKTAMRNNFNSAPFSVNPSEIIFKANNESLSITETAQTDYYRVENYLPKEGDELFFNIKVNGLESISANTTIPNKIIFNLKDYEFTSGRDPECPDCPESVYLKLAIQLDDGPEDNFYGIEIISEQVQLVWDYSEEKGEEPIPDTIWTSVPIMITSNDGIYEFSKSWGSLYLNTDLSSSSEGDKLFFKDDLLSGLKNTITISANIYSHGLKSLGDIPLKINLYSYDSGYYKYLRSLAGYNEFGEFPLSEPVYIHTNVENGRGILGGMSVSKRTYSLNSNDLN